MDPVEQIFAAFGSKSKMARRIRVPVTTAHTWFLKRDIPYWRRHHVLTVAAELETPLPESAVEYLNASDPKLQAAA